MRKLIFMNLILFGMLVLPLLCRAAKQEGIILQEGDGDLKLYYFADDISKFESKTIIKNCSAFQVFPNGVIYCVGKWDAPYQEKILPEFGIKLVLIKEMDNSRDPFSGVCVNPATQEMYFTKRESQNRQRGMALYKLNFKSGEETRLTNQKFIFIGIPALSPDGKKVAFYCSTELGFKLQVAYYNLESKVVQIIAPPSTPVFPFGPYMGGAPVWRENSSEIYFMAVYHEILKKKGFSPGVYKVAIDRIATPELVCEGLFPTSSNNEITCTFLINHIASGIWRIYPPPAQPIFRECFGGKISPSSKFVAFTFKSAFYVGKIDKGQKNLLHNRSSFGADCWWIEINIAPTK